jgi:hypothetical protein
MVVFIMVVTSHPILRKGSLGVPAVKYACCTFIAIGRISPIIVITSTKSGAAVSFERVKASKTVQRVYIGESYFNQ